ncbi:GDSL esterase/lipase At5g45910 [Lolium perenne]|uniref:GDSL esterase/lipase At5g45910 n=1 Tax=Lolium perenne TaxID=4522 RepID=UPI0021F543B5|nr:GDSL esterase/lipase At5g45910-like [Lolium perenne]
MATLTRPTHLLLLLLLSLLSSVPRRFTRAALGMGPRPVLALLLAAALLAAAAAAGTADAAKAGAAKGKYRALFNFGDSLADAGNLLATSPPGFLTTAKLPYGQTYFGKPTGRCSDGRLVIDHLAEEFGFPLLPPSKLNRSDLTHGANFAITGATALDTPYFEARGLGAVVWNSGALMTQIQWFRDLKPFFCNSTKEECKEFYANSLFVVGEFGGNDYNAPLFAGKGLTEAYKFMPDVIQGISDGVEALIAEGAVDLIVPGVMPTGCFPVYLNMLDMPAHEYGARSGCIRTYNTFSWVHNAHLKRALEKLRPKYPNARIIYGDYYTPVVQFMLQPEKFGFAKQLPRACCGAPGSVAKAAYNFNVTAKCGESGATACADPSTHWSWDGIHLTEAAYGHIARGWLYGPFADQPIVQSS